MDGNLPYLSFLGQEAISSIPEETVKIINEYIEGVINTKNELSTNLEKNCVNLEDVTVQLQTAQERIRVLNSTETKLSDENVKLRSTTAELQGNKNNLEQELTNVENSRQLVSGVLEKREQLISETEVELTSLKQRYDGVYKELVDSRLQTAGVMSAQTMLEAQLSRKKTECIQLIEERNTLDSEKLAYMRQISRLQMEKSSEISNHHHTQETTKNDLNNTEQLLETYKQQSESLAERLRQEQARHRECRDNFISSEESHRQELASQKKLTNMYKEAEQKVAGELRDLAKTAAEYKECFEQLTKEHEETMSQKLSEISELGNIITAKDEHIGQIEGELVRMNELMKESSESPDVTAELAKLIKSGLTYSQLYHKYHQTAEQLILEKAENTRINESFDTLLREMEIMKPQVIQIRTAYEASNGMVEKLSEQLKQNLNNLDAETRKLTESKRMATHYQKETERYKADKEDLASQVQILTKEIHIAKGGRVVDDDSSTLVSSTTHTSASVISTQLVSFRDIQELQKQNQQLRSALRELSAEQEKAESHEEGGVATEALKKELENTRQEVEHLKQSRLKQEELVQSIIKQKDMYKRLVEQGEFKEAQAKASPKRPITEVDNEKLKALNNELHSSKDALTKTQDEMKLARQKYEDVQGKLETQLESTQKELNELKLNNAKLTTQFDYSLESSKVLEKNVFAYKQEINALRTKAEQYSNLVAKNEALVSSLKQELSGSQQSSIKSEVSNQQLRTEVELLKTSCRRAQLEADTAKKDCNLQLQMLSNLQDIQTSIHQSNSEMKVHYQSRLEHMENDKQVLNKQIETLKQQISTADNLHGTEKDNLRHKVEQLEKELSVNQEKLIKSIEEQKTQRQSSVNQGSTSGEGTSGAEDAVESQDLKQAKSEITALKDQLRLTGEASDEYRQASDRLELTLREQTTTNTQIQESLEKQITQLQSELDTIRAQHKQVIQQNDTTFEQKTSLETELAQLKSSLSNEIAELKSSLNSYKQRLQSKEQVEAQARADLQQSAKLNEELSAKYQTELQTSMKATDECRKVCNEKETLQDKVMQLNNEVIKLELELKTNHTSFEEREKTYRQTLQALESQHQESKLQTTILHQQLEYLSSKQEASTEKATVSTAAASTAGEPAAAAEGEEQGENLSNERMLELIRILRTDKELYETKLEGSTAECKKLQAKVNFVEGELKLSKDELAGQKSQADIDIQTRAQHAELLRKVEQINVLTDSNRMLRQEKDTMQPKIDTLEKQVLDLQQAMVPLEQKSSEYESKVQSLEGEKISLNQAVEHWKQRVNNLLQKQSQERAEDEKKQKTQVDEHSKTIADITQQLNSAKAEAAKLKSSASIAEEEKNKLVAQIKELEEKVKSLEEMVKGKDDDLAKKEKMVNDLKKIGRTYKTKYTKLVEETGGGNTSGTASGGEGSTPTQSSSQTTSSAGEAESKLHTEISDLKEQLASRDEVITSMTSDLEDVKTKLTEANNKIAKFEEDLAADKNKNAKATAEFDELSKKHNTLKDFVTNSLKPKITTQKENLDNKQTEIVSLRNSKTHLENRIEEMQQELDEGKAKLMSLMEEKSMTGPNNSQSSHISASADSKREVKTIEVRPMAQHKQLTATVMPTTSVAEPQDVQSSPSTSVEEPVVGIVPPSAQQQTANIPSSSSGNSGQSVISDLSSSQFSSSFSSSALPAVTVTPSTIVSSPAVQSVSPQTVVSTQPHQPQTSGAPVVTSQPQQSSAEAPAVPTHSMQSTPEALVMPIATGEPVVSSQSNVLQGAPGVPSQSFTPVTSAEVPTAIVSGQAGTSAQQPIGSDTEAVSQSTSAEIDTLGAGDGTSMEQASGNEAGRAKRTRDDYEADDENEAPDVKRTREAEAAQASTEEESYEQEAEEASSQDLDTDLTDFEPVVHGLSVEPAQQSYSSPGRQQEPTYSGADRDVVIIVSSDDEDDQPVQPSYQQVDDDYGEEVGDISYAYGSGSEEGAEYNYYPQSQSDGEEGSGHGEVEEEEDEAGSDDNYEQQEEEGSEAEQMGSYGETGEERDTPADADDDYEEDNSDIIMIEDDQPDVASTNLVSVSSSQPGSADRPADTYQSQGSVSIDTNQNDDGIVPSTPTLALPNIRNDGFAVAVSSPNMSVEPFLFGSSMVPSSEFGALAEQAEVMEDFGEAGMSSAASNEVDGAVGTAADAAEAATISMHQEHQSNVVSTESDDTDLINRLSTEEVTSSEANEAIRSRHIEPIVWGEAPLSQSDQPSSSSQTRPNTARRGGRGRGGRLNRPTFNKPPQ